MPHKLIPTILCGGAGSRLWPVSREQHPKPFIRLTDGQSLLQKAFLRAIELPNVVEILTVTSDQLLFKTNEEFNEVCLHPVLKTYILEPFGRNTAAAIACAALQASKEHDQDAVLLVLAADHLISDQAAFEHAVERATVLANQDKLVTFGIRPTGAETGYGYIEARNEKVIKFVEKPNLETAQRYVDSGDFLWNSGIFCFRAGAVIAEMEQHCPDLLQAVRRCLETSSSVQEPEFCQIKLDSDTFADVPDISIDYALLEKSTNVAVVACDIGWRDIGSWVAMGDLVEADVNGNRIDGNALLYNTRDCFIQSPDRLVGAVGVKNLLIIDTPDALLIADKGAAQDVKAIYDDLKAQDNEVYKIHRTVYRPWGSYTVLEESDNFKIKRLEVKPGGRLSLQMHHHRSEHWVVVSGMARVINGKQEMLVSKNESTYIPAGHQHRLENPGVIDLVLIEVQSGEYLGEDDIVRFEDLYGRA